METYLSSYWKTFPEFIWKKLEDDMLLSHVEDADFYIEIARPAYEHMRTHELNKFDRRLALLDKKIRVYAKGDNKALLEKNGLLRKTIEDARTNFSGHYVLNTTSDAINILFDFHNQKISENDSVEYLRIWYGVMSSFSREHIQSYLKILQKFLIDHSIRYLVGEDLIAEKHVFSVHYNPPVLLMERALTLRNHYLSDKSALPIYEDFHNDISRLYIDSTGSRFRSSLRTSSNLIEESGKQISSTKKTALNGVISNLPGNCFVHPKFTEILNAMDNFFNDFRGGRHSGRESTLLRDLEEKDVVLVAALSLFFSDFILRKEIK